jgi:hypothetical protein
MKDVVRVKGVNVLARYHVDLGIPLPVQVVQLRKLRLLLGVEVGKIVEDNLHQLAWLFLYGAKITKVQELSS